MTRTIRETATGDRLVVVSTGRCKRGRQRQFESLVEGLGAPSRIVLHDPGSPEYHLARRFRDREALDAWLASPECAALHEALEEVADRVGTPERLSGLEPWFAAVARPPRWKMWLASFVGAYPLVVLFQWLVASRVEGLPLLVRSAVLPLVLLSLMTYVMMPVVTRMLAGWLEPKIQ